MILNAVTPITEYSASVKIHYQDLVSLETEAIKTCGRMWK